MKKKIFALLMAMVLVLGMSTTALAAVGSDWLTNPSYNSPYYDNTPEIGDFVWAGIAYEFNNEDKTSCSVVGLIHDGPYVAIPADVNGIAVTGIVDAFKDNSMITYVQIPVTVTFIDEFSFYNCSNLTDVFYNGVTYNEVSKFVVAYSANGGSFGSPNPAGSEFAGTKLAGAGEVKEPVEVKEMEVTWSETTPWTVVVENVTPEDECWDYYFEFYLDGECVDWDYTWAYSDDEVSMDMSWYVSMYGEGKYTVEVKAGDMNNLDDEDGVRTKGTSPARTYVEPQNKIPAPANVQFDKETGKLTFDTVKDAVEYEIYTSVYYAGQDTGKSWIDWVDAEDVTGNKVEIVLDDVFLENLKHFEEGDFYKTVDFVYSIEVVALSGNIDKLANSDYAKLVLFENKVSKEQVKENFDEAFAGEEIDVDVAVGALAGVSNDTIIEMLETDAAFTEKVEKLDAACIEELGDSYKGATSKTDVVDATKVKVVGLAINGDSGAESNALVIDAVKDDAKVEVPEGYEDGIQLDISFMIDDYSVETTLIVPVTITMQIPAGVEKENLVILHYHGDAETPDVIVPTVNADGTMTFSVGGFSTFVVTNEVDDTTAETPAPEAPKTETPAPEAPKTGDASTTTFVCSLLLLAAGVVLVSKRNLFVK